MWYLGAYGGFFVRAFVTATPLYPPPRPFRLPIDGLDSTAGNSEPQASLSPRLSDSAPKKDLIPSPAGSSTLSSEAWPAASPLQCPEVLRWRMPAANMPSAWPVCTLSILSRIPEHV